MSGSRRHDMGSSNQMWRRLRRHPLAMLGGFLVMAMTVSCFFVPMLGINDPETQYPWIGAQAPGHSHPLVLADNQATVGQPAQLPQDLLSLAEVVIKTEVRDFRELRLATHQGVITRLFWVEGAVPVESITLPDDVAVQRYRYGKFGPPLPSLTLTLGQTLPANIALRNEKVAFLRWYDGPAIRDDIKIFQNQGIVTAIHVNGQSVKSWRSPGEYVQSVSSNDREQNVFHLLGTDDMGRDLLSRVLYGGRISLMVGLLATLVSLVIGVMVGSLSGMLGGRWDRWIMGGVDVLYGIPFMFLVILLLVLFGRSLFILFIALGAVQWLTMSRIVRTQVMSIKLLPYIEAARLAQTPPLTMVFRHILPNMAGPIIIYATLTVPSVILEESFLAFIGLTVQFQGRSLDSWGALVHQGMMGLGIHGEHSWLLIFPSLAMGLTLLGLNLLGDGLRDALDPKHR